MNKSPMKRADKMLSIRPSLDLTDQHMTPIEKFQNMVIRPILKLQNDLLVTHFKHHLNTHKKKLNFDSQDQTFNSVKAILLPNNLLKLKMKMMVVALMTTEEYIFYQNHNQQLKNRLRDMIIKRLSDQLYKEQNY